MKVHHHWLNEQHTHLLTYVSNMDLKYENPVPLLGKDSILAWMETRWYRAYSSIEITSLVTNPKFHNQGLASTLLQHLSEFVGSVPGFFNSIRVTDSSDKFNQSRNVYLKNGFNYLEDGFPEMYKTIPRWSFFF